MLAGLAVLGAVWAFIDLLKWLNKESEYITFGNSISINGLTFNLYGEAYKDSTGTLLYARHKTFGDCYWLAPSMNLTQQQFFDKISELTFTPTNNLKVSRKRVS